MVFRSRASALLTCLFVVSTVLVVTEASSASAAPVAPVVTPAAASPNPTSYVPVGPTRLLDTRSTTPIPAGGTRSVRVDTAAHLPASTLRAATLTVTVVTPGRDGHLSVGPAGAAVSWVSFVAGRNAATQAVVGVGSDGVVTLVNHAPVAVQVVVDLVGVTTDVVSSNGFRPTTARLLDTRTSGAIPAGGQRRVPVASVLGVQAATVVAATATVTVLDPAASGSVEAGRNGGPVPRTSAAEFVAGRTVSRLAVVPTGVDGSVLLVNRSARPLQVVVDLAGVTTTAVSTVSAVVGPRRLLDTRQGRAIAPGQARAVVVPDATDVSAATLSLTALAPAAAGYVTAAGNGGAASVLSYAAGASVGTAAVVAPAGSGRITLTNRSARPLQLVVDLVQVTGRAITPVDEVTSSSGSAGASYANPGEHVVTPATVGDLHEAWRTGDGYQFTQPPPVVGGLVYLHHSDGNVVTEEIRALDVVTGEVAWQAGLDGDDPDDGIAADGNAVYVGVDGPGLDNRAVRAYDATTGRFLWRAHLRHSPVSDYSNPVLSVEVSRGRLVVRTGDRAVHVLDAATGAELGLLTDAWAAAVDGDLLVVSGTEQLQTYYLPNLTQLWRSATVAGPADMAVGDGRVVLSTGGGTEAYALTGCGADLCPASWKSDLHGLLGAVDGATAVLVGEDTEGVVAFLLDAGTGAEIATTHAGGGYASAQRAVTAGGVTWVPNGRSFLAYPARCTGSCGQLGGVAVQPGVTYPAPTLAIADGTVLVQRWDTVDSVVAYRVD